MFFMISKIVLQNSAILFFMEKRYSSVGIFGYNNLDAAKKLIDTFTARQERVITFRFCKAGAEEDQVIGSINQFL